MFLTLGDRYGLEDRGTPGAVSGWGIPGWGRRRAQLGLVGPRKPVKVGARYFCGDCESKKENKPVASGNKFQSSKAEYQLAVTAHYANNHPDLHYPIDQTGLDDMGRAKRKAASILRTQADLKSLARWHKHGHKWDEDEGVGGGVDLSSFYQPVTRPRELPDFSEFDFPDAAVADAGVEEIEFDQLISIAARMGRRFLGVEMQNIDLEYLLEFLTVPDNADLDINITLELNTRTGGHNLDDVQNIWRFRNSQATPNVEATAGTGTAVTADFQSRHDAPPGGVVYVAPRLFWRMNNEMDRQIDIGDLFARIATIDQRLTTFLLFELLEQYSGLFGFAA